MEAPDNGQMISYGDAYLRKMGILSDYHKNNIIIACLCICSNAKNVDLQIDIENKKIIVCYYVSRIFYYFNFKNKIIKNTYDFLLSYLSYKTSVIFKIYEKK